MPLKIKNTWLTLGDLHWLRTRNSCAFSTKLSHNSILFQTGSLVYSFNENGLRRIQYLQTYGASNAQSYLYNGDIFLIITNTRHDSITYMWNGNHFLKWLNFDRLEIFDKSYVEVVQNHILFFLINHKCVYVYDANPSDFKPMATICFEEPMKTVFSLKAVNLKDYNFLVISGLSKYSQPILQFIPFTLYVHQVPNYKGKSHKYSM